GVGVDSNQNLYVVGRAGVSFPSTPGSFTNTGHLDPDSFVAKFRDVAPFLATVDPSSGPVDGGTPVTLTGSDFTSGMSATFGGVAATVNFVSSTQLTSTTPPHAAGVVDVRVLYSNGTPSNPVAFTYLGQDGDGGTDGGTADGGATDGGGGGDGGVPDGGSSGQVDLLGCSCASGAAGPAAFAIAAMAVLAARARQRRRPTSTPPSQ
ncbi:MAG TPA: IPT/TIG domain-containing protein, partial [Myxococcales bacterium]|nr:IPT/TIG domain-containing protein [Myxococcales bacterium]